MTSLLCTDDLVLIEESLDELREKMEMWKECMGANILIVKRQGLWKVI